MASQNLFMCVSCRRCIPELKNLPAADIVDRSLCSSCSGSKSYEPKTRFGNPDPMIVGLRCFNCGTDKTIKWRRDVNSEIVCNACGLHSLKFNSPRPLSRIKETPIKRKPLNDSHTSSLPTKKVCQNGKKKVKPVRRCVNCGIEKTPQWRRDCNGETACNPCALHSLKFRVPRPLPWKRRTTATRKSNKGSKSKSTTIVTALTATCSKSPGTLLTKTEENFLRRNYTAHFEPKTLEVPIEKYESSPIVFELTTDDAISTMITAAATTQSTGTCITSTANATGWTANWPTTTASSFTMGYSPPSSYFYDSPIMDNGLKPVCEELPPEFDSSLPAEVHDEITDLPISPCLGDALRTLYANPHFDEP